MNPRKLYTVEDAPGYNSWPMIAAVKERLICIYSCGKAHDIWESCRKVCARTSADGGVHWSAAVDVVNSEDCGDVPEGKGLDETGSALFWVRVTGINLPAAVFYTGNSVQTDVAALLLE